MSKVIGSISAAIVAALAFWIGMYWWNIPFNFGDAGSVFFYGIFAIALPLSIFIGGIMWDRELLFPSAIPFVGLLFLFLVGGFSSCEAFNANSYAAQLAVPDEAAPFTQNDIPAFDPTQIPWVDERYAEVLGDKPIGQLGAIGSSIEMGECPARGGWRIILRLTHTSLRFLQVQRKSRRYTRLRHGLDDQ